MNREQQFPQNQKRPITLHSNSNHEIGNILQPLLLSEPRMPTTQPEGFEWPMGPKQPLAP